jgi:hypothetical protein
MSTAERKDLALAHLATLLNRTPEDAGVAVVTFQTFPESPEAKAAEKSGGSRAEIFHDRLDDLFESLDELNEKGHGIFVTINKTDLNGRKKENIIGIRGWVGDLDDKLKEDGAVPESIPSLPLEPTMVVATGHGFHAYYLRESPGRLSKNYTVKDYEATLLGMAIVMKDLGGDPKMATVERCARLSGFDNMKGEPVLVRVVKAGGPRYRKVEEITSIYPLSYKASSKSSSKPKIAPQTAEPAEEAQTEDLPPRVDPTAQEVEDMAAEFLLEAPEAVEGKNGSDTCFKVALELVNGFDLDEETALRLLLEHYNPRCEGPWSDDELRHKVEDATRIADEGGSRGWKLQAEDMRPKIYDGEEHKMVKAIVSTLADKKVIYSRCGDLVHLTGHKRNVTGHAPAIYIVTPALLTVVLSEFARFMRRDKKGKEYQARIPNNLAVMALSMKEWHGFAELRGVVETPVFLADGRILLEPGMDEESHLFHAPRKGHVYNVADAPTLDDAKIAVAKIYDRITDFPFSSTPSREVNMAAFLAALLTIVGRFAINGPVPFILLDANSPAAGKGLLTTVLCIIALNRVVPFSPVPTGEDELRKTILTFLMEGHRVAVLDNCPSVFGGHAFNAWITAYPEYSDRVLGKSERKRLPANTICILNGNNVSLKADTPRRALPIRLESTVERPEDRDEFRYPNLVEAVTEAHGELLSAALTILRAFHVAGRPCSGLKKMAGFEAWSDLIRDAVHWVCDAARRYPIAG